MMWHTCCNILAENSSARPKAMSSFGKDGEPQIVIPKKHGRKVEQIYPDTICERRGLDEG